MTQVTLFSVATPSSCSVVGAPAGNDPRVEMQRVFGYASLQSNRGVERTIKPTLAVGQLLVDALCPARGSRSWSRLSSSRVGGYIPALPTVPVLAKLRGQRVKRLDQEARPC